MITVNNSFFPPGMMQVSIFNVQLNYRKYAHTRDFKERDNLHTATPNEAMLSFKCKKKNKSLNTQRSITCFWRN